MPFAGMVKGEGGGWFIGLAGWLAGWVRCGDWYGMVWYGMVRYVQFAVCPWLSYLLPIPVSLFCLGNSSFVIRLARFTMVVVVVFVR